MISLTANCTGTLARGQFEEVEPCCSLTIIQMRFCLPASICWMKFALAWLAVLGARLRLRVDLEKASLARLATACLPSFTIIFEVERSPDLCDPGSINVQTVFSCNIKHRHRNISSPSPIQKVLRAIQERCAAAERILPSSLAEAIRN
ncbi:hypothetical protein CN128_28545 [Sinorhizobium meliloti]|uniref:Uncharacterized protein n=2 Tax=Rhizobium meliloti TaxID=382 RepID=Q92YK6_RHIME|nr:hypothetical protein SMa1595 [Sinorhizobium meliloti 1021]AGG70564.1 Hypothetical protein SM2011_a1595 [Sinorhizobium meliloti 2011]ARS67655.1 hypothetical protein SMRU11_03760 [Sinorhizobium meliloti RU11/001]ASP55016.1 hypothetical protein CDO31_25725 [Sinorhizobium meliloti]ASP61527.1 hypothetical protein CDO30_24295 [Sinorhizobium meliloti]